MPGVGFLSTHFLRFAAHIRTARVKIIGRAKSADALKLRRNNSAGLEISPCVMNANEVDDAKRETDRRAHEPER